MSALEEIIRDLRSVERDLQDKPELGRRIHDIASRLSGYPLHWISTTEAMQLLGVRWEKSVEALAELGLLSARREADGSLSVLLEDVLRQREVRAALEGDGDDRDLTDEELEMLGRTRREEPQATPAR